MQKRVWSSFQIWALSGPNVCTYCSRTLNQVVFVTTPLVKVAAKHKMNWKNQTVAASDAILSSIMLNYELKSCSTTLTWSLMAWRWHAKKTRDSSLLWLTLAPLPPAHSFSPSTECLLTGVHSGPACQLEYSLTFNLWPPEAERHWLNLLSRRYILRTTVMTTEGSDGRYRCYRYSSKLLLSYIYNRFYQEEQRNGLRISPSPPPPSFPSAPMLLG